MSHFFNNKINKAHFQLEYSEAYVPDYSPQGYSQYTGEYEGQDVQSYYQNADIEKQDAGLFLDPVRK